MQHDCSTRNRERAGMPLTSYTNYIPAICHICWLISLHFRQETLSEGTAAARKRGGLGARGGCCLRALARHQLSPHRDEAPAMRHGSGVPLCSDTYEMLE